MDPWLITYHAAVRFAERVDRSLTPEDATRAIESLLPLATLLPERTLKNSERWALPGIEAVIVARLDPKIGARVAVTVLGPREMVEDGATKAVVAAYLRVKKFVEPPPGPPEQPVKQKGRKAKGSDELAILKEQHRNLMLAHRRLAAMTANEVSHITHELAKSRRSESIAREAEATANVAKKPIIAALRVAVIALRGGECFDDALRAIAAIDPGFVSDAFCYPERFTKRERREAAAQIRDKRDGVSCSE